MYPSDYGYATSGGSAGRDICLATALQNWAETNCYSNDWLYNHIFFWTLTSYFNSSSAFTIGASGFTWGEQCDAVYNVKPTTYLKSMTKIISGSGTKERPYILGL